MLSKLPFVLAIASTLLITGCNDDDPVNDSGIEDVIEFKIADYDKVTSSTDLAGVWVAVGTGTFERDKSGDRKYGEQSAKIYFMITGEEGNYDYANCFDEGRLEEGGFDRGGFDSLTVVGDTIKFDSDLDGVDSDDDGTDDLSSEDDDTSNTGTITDNSEINATFTFDDGDSKEVNTFQMYKVSNDSGTALGTSIFKEDNEVDAPDTVGCFAQWSGSYSTSDGYYTVERFDASFVVDDDPFTASEYISDAEDITEYLSLSYDNNIDVNTQDSDTVNFFYSVKSLYFGAVSSGSTTDQSGIIDINHNDL